MLHQYEELGFSSLTQMKDDYTFSLPHLYIFSLRGRENILCELGSARVNWFAGFTESIVSVTAFDFSEQQHWERFSRETMFPTWPRQLVAEMHCLLSRNEETLILFVLTPFFFFGRC